MKVFKKINKRNRLQLYYCKLKLNLRSVFCLFVCLFFKECFLLWYIHSFIIIIKPCQLHGFSWLPFNLCPYWPLLLASPLDSTQDPYRTDKYKVLLVSQHWCVYVWESIQEHHILLLAGAVEYANCTSADG